MRLACASENSERPDFGLFCLISELKHMAALIQPTISGEQVLSRM